MKEFNQFIKKELNIPQQKAVIHKKGAIIVIAGAGSGKTRIITARIANLILNENTNPNSIVALTFTNKAANEMKTRLMQFLGSKKHLPFVGTFHSYCLLLLRKNPTLLPYPQFSIMDSDDQITLIKKILKKSALEKQFSANEIIYQISNLKNKFDPNFYEQELSNKLFKEIYFAYESEKNLAHCFDFDDLMLEILKIFRKSKEFKNKFLEKIKHILVDEYQDTNLIQHELLKQMSLNKNQKLKLNTICIVGDEDQSIYSWRGALASNMMQFEKDFKPVTKIKIEQNYRSVQPILEAANMIIKNNKKRTNKNLWSEKKAKNRILSLTCIDEKQEADAITHFISSLPIKTKLNEIAILYRTHFQSRNIEERLIRTSIPYKIIGGIRFYERKEIKDLIAYLKLIVNPYDRNSLLRIINCPQRGLGTKFEEILFQQWDWNSLLDFKQLIHHIIKNDDLKITTSKKQSILNFINIYKNLSKEQKPLSILDHIINKVEYFSYLQKKYDQQETDTKIENIKEFVRSAQEYEQKTSENSLETFLQEIALLQEKTTDAKLENNQIQCMTLHAAKGLEFDNIIITGLEEGILPSYKSLNTTKELEEERRLFYVGITRAKERLLLLHTHSRNNFGQINDQVISRFLTEMPNKLIKHQDISEKNIFEIKKIFNTWLNCKKSDEILTFPSLVKPIIKTKKNFKNQKKKLNKLIKPKWKKNNFVKHQKFGVGIIKKVEQKETDLFYITAIFKSGEKKILSNFLSLI
ncbi:AAA family ATPase [Candidatus Dependentiae bacterium]|nr:AAA family ATPase [Candidatus Dependentiae bacterium]